MIDRQKMEAIAKKLWRDRRGNSLLIENDEYYDSKTFANPDQEDGLNSLRDD